MRQKSSVLAVATALATMAASMGNAGAVAAMGLPVAPAANEKDAQPAVPLVDTRVQITIDMRAGADVPVGHVVAQALNGVITMDARP